MGTIDYTSSHRSLVNDGYGNQVSSQSGALLVYNMSNKGMGANVGITDSSNNVANIISTSDGYSLSVHPITTLVSTLNSSFTPLGGNSTFTGIAEDVSQYSEATVIATADQNGVLSLEQSTDGTNWDYIATCNTTAGLPELHSKIVMAKYFRVVYKNPGSAQSYLRLQTIYSAGKNTPDTVRLSETIDTDQDAIMTMSALVGSSDSGLNIIPVGVTNTGALKVFIAEPQTAFGEVLIAEPTPVCQVDFAYGINSNQFITTLTGSGSATTDGYGLMSVNTTAHSSSSAQITTRRYLKYRAGQGARIRFTAMFSTPASGSQQIAGFYDGYNGYAFGYNNTTFGILYRSTASGSTVDTWIPQTSWNTDTLLGTDGYSNLTDMTLNPQKGNVYQIVMTYLGFGNIRFYIMNPLTGQFTLVHQLKYPNANTVQLLSNPSNNLTWGTYNTTNTSAITVSAASGGLFVDGDKQLLGNKYGLQNSKSGITTETCIINIQVNPTFNGHINKTQVNLKQISISGNGGSGINFIRMVRNGTIGGTPNYTNVDSVNSSISYDVAGTTIANGTCIWNGTINGSGTLTQDLSDLDMELVPGDVLSITGAATGSGSLIGISVALVEDL